MPDDYIDNETPATTASTIDRGFCPVEDGVFEIRFNAHAQGNGHGTPSIWNVISIRKDNGDLKVVKPPQHVAWEDGPIDLPTTVLVPGAKGSIYEVHGMSGNENADATGVEMRIRRVH